MDSDRVSVQVAQLCSENMRLSAENIRLQAACQEKGKEINDLLTQVATLHYQLLKEQSKNG